MKATDTFPKAHLERAVKGPNAVELWWSLKVWSGQTQTASPAGHVDLFHMQTV